MGIIKYVRIIIGVLFANILATAPIHAEGTSARVTALHASTFEKYVTETGDIKLPENFAMDWTFMGTWAIAEDGGVPDIHNVYAPKEVIEYYRENGDFADGAIMVKEVLNARGSDHTTGNAHWVEDVKVWFVMIRDTQNRFPNNGIWGEGWGWGLFEGKDPTKQVSTDYKKDCLGCHIPAQKDNWIYLYGYPILGESVRATAPKAEIKEADSDKTELASMTSEDVIKRGGKVFKLCKTCHTLNVGKHRTGPSLAGLFGRKAGTIEGFKFTDAMKDSGIVWSGEALDAFLSDVTGFIPDNGMGKVFKNGIKKSDDRAALIEYLINQK